MDSTNGDSRIFDELEAYARICPQDHRQGSELMQTLLKNLDSLSAAKETDRVLAVHPSLIYQNPSFSKFYFETDSVDAGKNFLANCLRVNPKSGWLWRLLYALEDIGGVFGTVESATRIAELAMEFMSSKDGELFQELRKRLTLPLTGNVA
ncbi:hypothetical protein BC830DRAFT_1086163 [Chytriomyces sp. MP71]|nr:hypothetical protein BC830DRAFT_1086163 [Chytriomyces sp. MP71]